MIPLQLYRVGKDEIRRNLNKYTRKAFQIIPETTNPKILDIGCGTGVPTLELASLSEGEIVALDMDPVALEQLQYTIDQTGLGNRIRIINHSLAEMDFPGEYFDIIWSEGAVYALGFQKMLKKAFRMLKIKGFLVLHDDKKDMKEKMALISPSGFHLVSHFELSKACWWEEYYVPLEQLISKYREESYEDPKLSRLLERDQADIDLCRTGKQSFESFFVVMQKMR